MTPAAQPMSRPRPMLRSPWWTSRIVRGLDHEAQYVVLSPHAPIAGTGWAEALVPLSAETALAPTRLRVARLRYDALFETGDFLATVHELTRFGGLVRQFSTPPRADVDLDDPRTSVRVARYRAFQLRVGIDLPHPREVANLVALSDDLLDESLDRLRLP